MKAPAGLSAEARRFWSDVAKEYRVDDAAGTKYLARACEALDRLREAQARIKREGAVIPDKKGSVKAHPAIAIEKEAHKQFMEAMRALNLDIMPKEQ
jgi:P27 family predicted phage terminase small subunit